MNLLRSRRSRLALITAAGVAGAGAAALILGLSGHPRPPAVIDISRNFKVCMLATVRGTPAAGVAWNAIGDARRKAAVNAEQLTAPASPASQQIPYLNSLISLRCRLIVVAGPDLRKALASVATANPDQRFLSYGTGAPPLPNIRQIPDGDTAAITAAIIGAAKSTHGNLMISP